MKEILTLQVGNAGNMIGQSFWDLMVNEHDIKSNPQNTQMLFQEYKQGYFARNLMMDMDPNSIDKILASNNPIYNPDNTINLKHGCSNIYAEGYKPYDFGFIDNVIDKIRKKIELLDKPNAIQFILSLSGGCGSGFGSLLSEKLNQEYGYHFLQQVHHLVFPSQNNIDNNPFASYNTILALNKLIEFSSLSFCYDNQSILQMNNFYKDYGDVNKVIARTMSDLTSGMRFKGHYSMSFQKFAVQTVMFPRLHFFGSIIYPVHEFESHKKYSFSYMCDNLIQKKRCSYNISQIDRTYSGQIVYRGNITTSEAEELAFKVQNQLNCVEWVANPIGIQHSYHKDDSINVFTQGGYITSSWKQLCQNFIHQLRRHSYVHYYVNLGMEEMEFTEAESNINDLISEYQPCSLIHEEEEEGNDDSVLS